MFLPSVVIQFQISNYLQIIYLHVSLLLVALTSLTSNHSLDLTKVVVIEVSLIILKLFMSLIIRLLSELCGWDVVMLVETVQLLFSRNLYRSKARSSFPLEKIGKYN